MANAIFTLLLVQAGICAAMKNIRNISFPVTSEWINNLPRRGYDPCRTPTFNKGRSTAVKIGLYVESMGNFQATTMDYDADIYFKEYWIDERLAHPNADLPGFNDEALINKIWRPDVYFANSKEAKTNLLTAPNTYMRISEDGSVFYSIRVNLKLTCNMEFHRYPLDEQTCAIRIIAYGHTVDEMNATWLTGADAVSVNPSNAFSELNLTHVETVECDGRYPTGVYSCLEARFHLSRHVMFYLIQNYVPTGLIVCVSWISFWIDPASVPGRLTLAVSTMLTLATQSAAIMQTLPPVTYMKAIDLWLGICLVFVFGTLIEYAYVNSLKSSSRRHNDKNFSYDKSNDATDRRNSPPIHDKALKNCNNNNRAPLAEIEGLFDTQRSSTDVDADIKTKSHRFNRFNCLTLTLDGHAKATRLECMCRILFPSTFAAFNFIYWLYYWPSAR